MVRSKAKLLILIFISSFALACASSPWATERKEEIRTEQARDFDEKTNVTRRLSDLEAGAAEAQEGEADALRARIAALEAEILQGDQDIVEVEKQDTNSQISLWASIAAGVLGIGGLGKATYGKSRSASLVDGLQLQLDRGELEVDRLSNELHRKIDAAEAILNQKLGQVAALLQAVQAGLSAPIRTTPPPSSPNDSSTPPA